MGPLTTKFFIDLGEEWTRLKEKKVELICRLKEIDERINAIDAFYETHRRIQEELKEEYIRHFNK